MELKMLITFWKLWKTCLITLPLLWCRMTQYSLIKYWKAQSTVQLTTVLEQEPQALLKTIGLVLQETHVAQA
jgi:hypothetical protein